MECIKCGTVMTKGKYTKYCKKCIQEHEERVRLNGVKNVKG
jgi:hypothetical protein